MGERAERYMRFESSTTVSLGTFRVPLRSEAAAGGPRATGRTERLSPHHFLAFVPSRTRRRTRLGTSVALSFVEPGAAQAAQPGNEEAA